jgi:hypothetical protein
MHAIGVDELLVAAEKLIVRVIGPARVGFIVRHVSRIAERPWWVNAGVVPLDPFPT